MDDYRRNEGLNRGSGFLSKPNLEFLVLCTTWSYFFLLIVSALHSTNGMLLIAQVNARPSSQLVPTKTQSPSLRAETETRTHVDFGNRYLGDREMNNIMAWAQIPW